MRHLPRPALRVRPAERALRSARRTRHEERRACAPCRRCATWKSCRRSPSTTWTKRPTTARTRAPRAATPGMDASTRRTTRLGCRSPRHSRWPTRMSPAWWTRWREVRWRRASVRCSATSIRGPGPRRDRAAHLPGRLSADARRTSTRTRAVRRLSAPADDAQRRRGTRPRALQRPEEGQLRQLSPERYPPRTVSRPSRTSGTTRSASRAIGTIPANEDPAFRDLGLCGPLRTDLANHQEYCGEFRVPSLRNVAVRRALFHNGAFHRWTR